MKKILLSSLFLLLACIATEAKVVKVTLTAGSEGGEGTEPSPLAIYMSIHEQLQKLGISEQELMEMSEDSGIDMTKFLADHLK